MVVLPAPGGATRTAAVVPSNAAESCGRIVKTGSLASESVHEAELAGEAPPGKALALARSMWALCNGCEDNSRQPNPFDDSASRSQGKALYAAADRAQPTGRSAVWHPNCRYLQERHCHRRIEDFLNDALRARQGRRSGRLRANRSFQRTFREKGKRRGAGPWLDRRRLRRHRHEPALRATGTVDP